MPRFEPPNPNPTPPNPTDIFHRPPQLINQKPSPNFQVICALFDQLRDRPERKRDVLVQVLELWQKNVGPDVYPFFRLLLPDRDRERPVYGLKESGLAKAYVSVLGLDPRSGSGHRLIHWKTPTAAEGGAHSAYGPGIGQGGVYGYAPAGLGGTGGTGTGDFANVCYEAIKARKSTGERADLTVDGVNGLLDRLSRGRNQKDHTKVMEQAMHHLSAEQQRWFIRIILKDLKIAVGERTVFSIFHPDAMELFNVSSDLKRVCWTLYDKSIKLPREQAEINLFRSFLPQLCRRSGKELDLDAVVKMMKVKPFLIEEKLDGERMQLHKRGEEYFYCSRKAKDYSYLYGANPGEGALTPFIHPKFRSNVENCVLDGEMMVWDPLVAKYLAFGTLKSAALDKSNSADAPRPCFKVFDILMINGKCTADMSLKTRKRLLFDAEKDLYRVFEPIPGRLELASQWEGNTADDIKDRLDWIMEERGEGLVIKNPASLYEVAGRTEDWVKVKPEYAEELGENFDLLVVGGWWGTGRRGGKLSSLLVALRKEDEEDDEDGRPKFVTFGSVGGGLKFDDYEWMSQHHKHHWQPFDRKHPPKWLEVGSIGVDDKPDVYILPEHSFVVAVKCSELVPTDRNYACEYTMRFPRCKQIRWDENSRDERSRVQRAETNEQVWNMRNCLTLAGLYELQSKVGEKRFSGSQQKPNKKRKMAPKRVATLAPAFAGQKAEVQAETNILKGKMFYVIKGIKGSKLYDTKPLELFIAANGGDFCQRCKEGDDIIPISSMDKLPGVNGPKKWGMTVVKPEWVIESVKRRRQLPFIEQLVLFASPEDQARRNFKTPLADLEVDDFDMKHPDEDDDATDPEEEEEEPDIKEEEDRYRKLPPADIDLGGEWKMRGVQQSRVDDESDDNDSDATEPEPDLEEDDYTGPQDIKGGKASSDVDSDATDDEEQPHQSPRIRARSPATMVKKMEQMTTAPPADEEPAADSSSGPREKEEVRIGEDDQAMNYDQTLIFKHLMIYLDTPDNASKNDLTSTKPRASILDEMSEIQNKIIDNGGRITSDLNDPKLTHIVQHEGDGKRVKELVRHFHNAKRRHIVIRAWVTDSLDEETLLPEDVYKN